jgi:long-chain acyl-CoA synthetase
MNLAHLLARSGRVHGDAPAVLLGARTLFDYRTLAQRAASVAGYLREVEKLVPGERVAIYMSNTPEYLEILYGIWWAGLVAVPVNAKLHARELAFILDDSGAAVLFVAEAPDAEHASAVCRVVSVRDGAYRQVLASQPLAEPATCDPTDLAWLFYTSGTTGQPKGVMITHRNLHAMIACYFAEVEGVCRDDAVVYAAPMSHGAGIYNFAHVMKGARHVVPESGGFEPDELIELSRSVGRLSLFAAPTMVRRLVDCVVARGADPSGFKTIIYGGGPMYVDDIKRALAAMGERFVQIYGQGESPMTITALSRECLADAHHPDWERRIASVGVAQYMVEVQVVDADGRPLPAGATGEITVRGETVMKGYWNNPAATAATLRDGWLWTGDLGAMDAQGFLTLKDRSKDVIISGGSNIYPREVEEVLLQHPGVREVSVVGKADAEWGEVVVAFVVADSVGAEELDRMCLDHIARFKRPKEYRFVDALPKNNYGKVLKTALRELL